MAPTEANADARPYRPCVGVCLFNRAGAVFAGQRIDNPSGAWQMPQGGIEPGEAPRAAALRELGEETGVPPEAVEIVAEAKEWTFYDLPADLVPRLWNGRYCGQTQLWYLMRFTGADGLIDIARPHPEFSAWAWMPPAALIERIVPFKRATYEAVFAEFRAYLK